MTDDQEWPPIYYREATPEQLQAILDSLDAMSSQMLDVISAWMKGTFTLSFVPIERTLKNEQLQAVARRTGQR